MYSWQLPVEKHSSKWNAFCLMLLLLFLLHSETSAVIIKENRIERSTTLFVLHIKSFSHYDVKSEEKNSSSEWWAAWAAVGVQLESFVNSVFRNFLNPSHTHTNIARRNQKLNSLPRDEHSPVQYLLRRKCTGQQRNEWVDFFRKMLLRNCNIKLNFIVTMCVCVRWIEVYA